ncbi:hypothetical protein BJF92_21395 [Rhizobium rhizosphaerae]|uniref:Uncharacterized protein n=1 Tax=Xaviernesmea rhizosphaerae TaxID=1672749 RepID=A0A1Q9ANT8_9HYPH|nr:hypothetical protein [Xaviernesmea rhizosphaerae]OLP57059.1 hypothetical protein BJF92_21395 [Xaviernesmea rhizosphaerae]
MHVNLQPKAPFVGMSKESIQKAKIGDNPSYKFAEGDLAQRRRVVNDPLRVEDDPRQRHGGNRR